MHKTKIILTFIITIILVLNLNTIVAKAANETYKSILNVDTNLNSDFYIENGIHIEGWILSTKADTKLNVYLDGKKLDSNYIKYSLKYDLISIVQGYGTYAQNPKPNFDINIPKEELSIGKHTIKIDFITKDETLTLKSIQQEINITRNIKHILNVDTSLEGKTFDKTGIEIKGWKLATEANTKLVIKIDEAEVENTQNNELLYDLISIVPGYGSYNENPKPNFTINIPTTNISNGKHKIQIYFVTSDGIVLEKYEKNIIIDKTIKSILNIDTSLEGQTFDKDGIKIEGWRLAKEANTELKVELNGQEIEYTQKDEYLYDLISIVSGYGTYKENPTPNFTINIPTTNITDGTYKLTIKLVRQNGEILQKVEKNIIIDKTIKSILNIDTSLEGQTFDKYGIKIKGWRLAKEANTSLKVELNGQEIEYTQKDEYLYDLISIVPGYGTYKENPTPNFTINIPTTSITDGTYKLTIKLVRQNGEILQKVEKNIIIDKSIKHILNIDADLNNIVFNEIKTIRISGWMLATEANSKLRILMDGVEIDSNYIKYSLKYDLISIVPGYGTYEENPTPNFDINIPTANISRVNHRITIQQMDPDGTTVLKSIEFIAKYGEKYDGIDVSKYNTVTNWNEVVQSGIDFVMVRIGYRGYRNPNIVLDPKALEFIKGAKSAGLKVGVYFYTQAITQEEAQEEALWVISQLHYNGIQLDFPIAIDTEDTGATRRGEEPGRADLLDAATRTNICRAFLDTIRYNGYEAMIYASSYWYKSNLIFSEISNYEIWLAHYTYNVEIKPNFSEQYHIWQYTDKGTIQGISGNVDLNVCYKKY